MRLEYAESSTAPGARPAWSSLPGGVSHRPRQGQAARWLLTLGAMGVVGILVVVPVVHVFYQALAGGVGVYWNYLVNDPYTRHAIGLTLTVAPVAVTLNVFFGVAAACAIARFR